MKIFLPFLLSFFFCASVSAAAPTFLDSDKNYILYADLGAHACGLYVDRHTCGIAEQSPSYLIILIDDVQVPDAADGSTRITNRFSHKFKFDLIHHSAFAYEPFSDSWTRLDPYITNPEDDEFTFDVTIAEIAFFLATNQKFFASFDDDFYSILL